MFTLSAPVINRSAPAASQDEPDAYGDQDERPEDVAAEPPQPTQVVQQEVESREDQDRRPEELVTPELTPHAASLVARGTAPSDQIVATTSNRLGLSFRAASTRSAPATVVCTAGAPSK